MNTYVNYMISEDMFNKRVRVSLIKRILTINFPGRIHIKINFNTLSKVCRSKAPQ